MDSIQVLEEYGLLDEDSEITQDLKTKIYCPFHSENVKSLHFDLQKDIFFCFGCGKKGDIIQFIAELEGINRLKAMQRVKRIAEGKEDVKNDILKSLKNNRQNKKKLLERAKKFYKEVSGDCDKCSEYLKNRGVDKKTQEKFGIKFNRSSQYPIVIPIFDGDNFKGYIQRRIDKGQPKYLYNKGFERLKTIVGKVNNDYPLLVVEGIFDLMIAYKYNYKNVVSIFGWKASEYQLERINEADVVISALDNDRAGLEGSKYLYEKLEGKFMRFQYLPYVKDIAELNQEQFYILLKKTFKKFNYGG
ncbi:MAG: CHC2 zinc finger domain-containing protein [Bacillota bacterium]